MNCSLCQQQTLTNYKQANEKSYLKCTTCDAVLLDARFFLASEAEKERYLLHKNDINDKGYQQFVSPITNSVLADFQPNTKGLDFGSGTGPVIAEELRKKGYEIVTYDPFFDNNEKALQQQYDFIVCCEVMEHFYFPKKEFTLLKSLLKPNGKLYCMTNILRETINFDSWYYKNDPTHVIFYTPTTVQWIAKYFGFKNATIDKNLIVFEA